MRGCPPFLSFLRSPHIYGLIYSYIGRLQNGETGNRSGREIQVIQRFQRWGGLLFLRLRGSVALLYGLFRELLQVFWVLLKVFKLFSKNF